MDLDDPDPARWWADAGGSYSPAEYEGEQRGTVAPTLADLIEQGAGRRRIARELGISESRARALLEQHRAAVAA